MVTETRSGEIEETETGACRMILSIFLGSSVISRAFDYAVSLVDEATENVPLLRQQRFHFLLNAVNCVQVIMCRGRDQGSTSEN